MPNYYKRGYKVTRRNRARGKKGPLGAPSSTNPKSNLGSMMTYDNAKKAIALAGAAYAGYQKLSMGKNVEIKYFDQASVGTVSGTLVGSTIVCNGLAVGDATTDRDGDQIRIRSVNMGIAVDNSSNATINTRFRLIVAYQKYVNQNQLAANELLSDPTQVVSPYGMDFEGYQVLYDKQFTLDGANGNGAHAVKFFDRFVWRPKKAHIKWLSTDTTGNTGNIVKGLIRFYIMCDGVVTSNPAYEVECRTRFIDN